MSRKNGILPHSTKQGDSTCPKNNERSRSRNSAARKKLAALSIALHQLALFLVAELMILSGGGDFLIVAQELRYHTDKQDVVFLDHPYECGVVAFEKE